MNHIAATQWTASHGRLLLVATVDPREIGRRIKKAREAKGLTQLAFALDANVSPSSVTRWEAGKLPPVRELMRIAELLGVEPDYLVEADPDEGVSESDGIAALRRENAELHARLARIEELLTERLPPPGTSRSSRPARPSSAPR